MSNNVDRLLRMMYREMLDPFFEKKNSQWDKFKVAPQSVIESSDYIKKMKQYYLKLYPENYSEDELDIIIGEQYNKLKKAKYDFVEEVQSKEVQSKRENIDAIYIFPYYGKKLLTLFNNEVHVKFEELFHWQGLINKVDLNVYLCAFLATQNLDEGKRYYQQLNQEVVLKHTNNRIYDVLSKGVAENHMHLGASGYNVELNWKNLIAEPIFKMNEIRKKVNDSKFLEEFKYFNFTKEIMMLYVEKIKLLRLYLVFVIMQEQQSNDENLDFAKNVSKALRTKSLAEYHTYRSKFTTIEFDVKNKLEAVKREIKKECGAYEQVREHIIVERWILTEMFKLVLDKDFCKKNGDKYENPMLYFNYYIAGSSQIKFSFLQDNIGIGFNRFKRFEADKGLFENNNKWEDALESVFDKYYSEKNVDKIEMRIGPNEPAKIIATLKTINKCNDKVYCQHLFNNSDVDNKEALRIILFDKNKEWYRLTNEQILSDPKRIEKFIKDYNLACCRANYKQLKKIKTGIIIHYIKLKDDSSGKNSIYKHTMRNKKTRDDLAIKSKYVEAIFANNSEICQSIVGIDAANYELTCRPEVFAQIYASHREKISKDNKLYQTYHAGEEFNTLANGLRAIDEAIEFLDLRDGDRIGHALALGTNVRSYFSHKRSHVFSTYQDHIDDISWMYNLILSSEIIDTTVLAYLSKQFDKWMERMDTEIAMLRKTDFAKPGITDYVISMTLRGDNPNSYISKEYVSNGKVTRTQEESKKISEARRNKTAGKLYWHYHFDSIYKKVGDLTLIETVNEHYIQAIELAQKIVAQKMIDRSLSIETNPTSNQKISIAKKYCDLPSMNFNQFGLTEKQAHNIPISINTDDSSIFQTNLNHEYSLIFCALKEKGYETEAIYRYLEYLRCSSMEQSFIKG